MISFFSQLLFRALIFIRVKSSQSQHADKLNDGDFSTRDADYCAEVTKRRISKARTTCGATHTRIGTKGEKNEVILQKYEPTYW